MKEKGKKNRVSFILCNEVVKVEEITWRNIMEENGTEIDFSEIAEEEKISLGNMILKEVAESLGYTFIPQKKL